MRDEEIRPGMYGSWKEVAKTLVGLLFVMLLMAALFGAIGWAIVGRFHE